MNNTTQSKQDYKKIVMIKTNKKDIFRALTKDLGNWWGAANMEQKAVGDIFKVSWNKPFYQFEVIEFKPHQKLAWKCIEANQIINGLEGVKKEWVGTELHWNIRQIDASTVELTFNHKGLIPQFICYGFCSTAWDDFIGNSLKNYLEKSI